MAVLVLRPPPPPTPLGRRLRSFPVRVSFGRSPTFSLASGQQNKTVIIRRDFTIAVESVDEPQIFYDENPVRFYFNKREGCLNLSIVNLSGIQCQVSIDLRYLFETYRQASFKMDINETLTTKLCYRRCFLSELSFYSIDILPLIDWSDPDDVWSRFWSPSPSPAEDPSLESLSDSDDFWSRVLFPSTSPDGDPSLESLSAKLDDPRHDPKLLFRGCEVLIGQKGTTGTKLSQTHDNVRVGVPGEAKHNHVIKQEEDDVVEVQGVSCQYPGDDVSALWNWSELPYLAIANIAERLPLFRDVIALRSVCKTWRTRCCDLSWRPLHPWMTIFKDADIFRNVLDSGRYQLEPWVVAGKQFFGCPQGLAIYRSSSGWHVRLLNRDSQTRTLGILPKNIQGNDVHEFILFAVPSGICVMIIFGVKRLLAHYRKGKWAVVKSVIDVKDVLNFGGRFYAIAHQGALVFLQKIKDDFFSHHVCDAPADFSPSAILHLVESSGNLLLVLQYGSSRGNRFSTGDLLIFSCDFTEKKWVACNDLGDSSLFISNGNCTSASAAQLQNCKRNSIYFVDNYWEQQDAEKAPPGSHYCGIFDVAGKIIVGLDVVVHLPADLVPFLIFQFGIDFVLRFAGKCFKVK